MADLIRWEPFRELVSLRDAMDRLFEESFVRPRRWLMEPERAAPMALDMYQTDNEVVVKAALPGSKPEDVEINVVGDRLTVKAESKEEKEAKEENYFRREFRYGSSYREINLPTAVQAEKAEATFENGIPTITIPKSEAVKPKTINVKATAKK